MLRKRCVFDPKPTQIPAYHTSVSPAGRFPNCTLLNVTIDIDDPNLELPSHPSEGLAPYTLAHTSDWHACKEAYSAQVRGRNQRGQDILRAATAVTDDIIAKDPPLVIIAGDIADNPRPSISYMLAVRRLIAKLAARRPDSTRRQVVVLAGNHDLPRDLTEPCWIQMLTGLPGVHVVSRGYEVIEFKAKSGVPAELSNTLVHCLPHDDLATVDFSRVTPRVGFSNVLTTHGVAVGSELFTRAIGREHPIPADVLADDWDYVALGHYHTRGPVSTATGRKVSRSRVWYSGAPENVTWSDLKRNDEPKGYLMVGVSPAGDPDVEPVDLPVRAMFRLPVIDATGKSPEAVGKAMIKNLEDASIDGALVAQVVEGATRDFWSLIDLASVRKRASKALHYDVQPRFSRAIGDDGDVAAPRSHDPLGELALVLDEQVAALADCTPEDRKAVLEMARSLLGDALEVPSYKKLEPEKATNEVVELPAPAQEESLLDEYAKATLEAEKQEHDHEHDLKSA